MDKSSMNAVASDLQAQEWARSLEDRERARSSLPLQGARKIVARHLGIAPGTLENLRRGRIKGVRAELLERLRACVVGELETEIDRLNHELEMARAGGHRASAGEIAEMAAEVVRLREIAAAKK